MDTKSDRFDHLLTDRRANENQHDQHRAERPQMRRRHLRTLDGARGFTLLEALIATALMAFILTALAAVTAQWMPNWNHGIARVQRSEDIALGLARLTTDLAAAEYIPASRESRRPLFDGANRSVIFVRTAVGLNSGEGLEIVRIEEINSDRGWLLVRTRAPFTPGIDRMQPVFTDPVVLLRAPYRLSFSYAGMDRNWHEEWRDQTQLPKAIKLSVQDAATQRTLSISTALLVRVDAPMECSVAKSLAECLASRTRPSEPEASNKTRS
jgi:general secretion pathway protein J